jgi:hypothetical protein
MFAVEIGTKRDINGNSRRGWIIFTADGRIHGFVADHGVGRSALGMAGFKDIVDTGSMVDRIQVAPAEYRKWAKESKRLSKNKRGTRRAKRTSRRNKRTSRRSR